MDKRRISRRQVLIGAGALGALTPLLGPAAARADDQGGLLRWDLVSVVSADGTTEVVAGGTDVAKADRGTFSLTGSGQASLDEATAAGGGTIVAKTGNGTVVGSGVYVVTGFISFETRGGSLAGAGLVDGIGEIAATTGGLLKLNVHVTGTRTPPFGGGPFTADAILEVHCHLPGSSGPSDEGIVVTVNGTTFTQDGGATLFHVLA
jgi:hypothetical protein